MQKRIIAALLVLGLIILARPPIAFAIIHHYSNTYQMTPRSPATWDAAYSIAVLGTYNSVFGTLCSVSLSSGGGASSCVGLNDVGTQVYFTWQFKSTAQTAKYWGGAYQAIAPSGNGTTFNENYALSKPDNNESIPTISSGGSLFQALIDSLTTISSGGSYYQAIQEACYPQLFIAGQGGRSSGFIYEPTVQPYLYANHTAGTVYQDSNTHAGVKTTNMTSASGNSAPSVLPSTCITTLVIPCTAFQQQCWWYPALFLGLFSTFVMLVVMRAKPGTRSTLFAFLFSLAVGSYLLVMLGLTSFVMPMLILAMLGMYAWRVGRDD